MQKAEVGMQNTKKNAPALGSPEVEKPQTTNHKPQTTNCQYAD